jgi:DNA-binding winged helix-turn-helix (wHTH) protein
MVDLLAGAVTSRDRRARAVPGGSAPPPEAQDCARVIPLAPGPLRCGAFRLEPEARRLRDAAGRVVELRPKSFDVLQVLLLRAGRLVGREELLDAVWGAIHVTDDSVTQCIVEIRRALGAEAGVVVRTVPRRGYILEWGATPAAAPEAGLAIAPFREAGCDTPAGLGTVVTESLAVELARQGGLRLLLPPAWLGEGAPPHVPGRGEACHLLRGTLWRAEERLCLVAQILEPGSARLVWAERFERHVAGPGPLRAAEEAAARIARAVVQVLPSLGSSTPAGATRVVRLDDRR